MLRIAVMPPHPTSALRSEADLCPHAGRGEESHWHRLVVCAKSCRHKFQGGHSWPTTSTSSSPIAEPRSRAIPARTGANRCAPISNACSAIADFIRAYAGDDQPRGVKVLYEDEKLGFQVLAHINDKARASPPHDHGASWAIYGQATQYTDVTEWAREDNGKDPTHAKLKPAKKYRLTPGHAGIYQDGAIHSIDYPDQARFIRVTGTDLEKINRIKIDLKTGEVQR